MKKTFTFQSKLKGYSLFAGSLLASSVVNAQVIYTDVIPDVQLGGAAPASYPDFQTEALDLNNDGMFDFKVTLNFYGTNTQAAGYSFIEKIDGDYFAAYNRVTTYTIEYVPWGFELECDDSIPIGINNGYHFAYFAYQAGAIGYYNWDNVVDGYVGLKFKVGNNIHYGWLRVDVNTMGAMPVIVIKDYAYEATPNQKIAACDVGTGIIQAGSEGNDQLEIYPNPSSRLCNIQTNAILSGYAQIILLNELGQEIFRTTKQLSGQKNELQFDFSFVAPGAYLVQLNTASGLFTGRFMKN